MARPAYLIFGDEEAPQRIREKIPKAKILIALRDPVERAYSHYLMNVREGVETLPFYEALQRNQEETSEGWGTSRLYIEAGLYAAQVRRYLTLFGPEQVHILLFEDLKREADKLLLDVARFLDIDPAATRRIQANEVHNPHLIHRGSLSASIMRSRRIHLIARACIPRKIALLGTLPVDFTARPQARTRCPRLRDAARALRAGLAGIGNPSEKAVALACDESSRERVTTSPHPRPLSQQQERGAHYCKRGVFLPRFYISQSSRKCDIRTHDLATTVTPLLCLGEGPGARAE